MGHMKRETEYTDEPMGEVRVVEDFLPSPDELTIEEETQDS